MPKYNQKYENFDIVYQRFSEYLAQKKLRQTPERFYILRVIFLGSIFFTLDSLREKMLKEKYIISKTTLYNTLDLLVDAKFIKQHKSNNKIINYQKLFAEEKNHILLLNSGEKIEFENAKIDEIKKDLEKNLNIKIEGYSLTFFAFKHNK